MTRKSVCIIVLLIAIFVAVYFALTAIDGFCTCTGFGVQSAEPVYRFWEGASLDASSPWGTWPKGCASASFGWPQMAEQPFSKDCAARAVGDSPYGSSSYTDLHRAYTIGSDEMRDIQRDIARGLAAPDMQQQQGGTGGCGSGGGCCDCKAIKPSVGPCGSWTTSTRAFFPLSAIEGARPPPGAILDARPCGTVVPAGLGRYPDLGVGVL